jgi:hypothetical protein
MTDDEVRRFEPGRALWADDAAGRFANCAIVGIGGSERTFLQPKILPSRWEREHHWPGRTVRYFVGEFVAFIVLICSELLGRPDNYTTLSDIVTELRRRRLDLNLLIWIQHNPDPRSGEFVSSLNQLTYHRPTTLVVSSGNRRERRLRNFAVSGAIVPTECLPTHFVDLDSDYRYVEPISQDLAMSRIVLLRYDADAYRVETVLSDAIRPGSGTARGEIFHQSRPYLIAGDRLVESSDNLHLVDITARACNTAVSEHGAVNAHVTSLQAQLASLHTRAFLGWLDVAIIPRPASPDVVRHAAGQQHSGGDTFCRCWSHRVCLDHIADIAGSAGPVAEVLAAAAAIAAQNLEIVPLYDRERRTNFRLTLRATEHRLGIVHPLDYNGEVAELAIRGAQQSTLSSPYVILGPRGRRMRRSSRSVDVTQVPSVGAIDQARATPSVLNALFADDFWQAVDDGTLAQVLAERLIGRLQ